RQILTHKQREKETTISAIRVHFFNLGGKVISEQIGETSLQAQIPPKNS
ncbi:4013_t:CDS:1, partial [Racocetra persica]